MSTNARHQQGQFILHKQLPHTKIIPLFKDSVSLKAPLRETSHTHEWKHLINHLHYCPAVAAWGLRGAPQAVLGAGMGLLARA